MPNESLIAKLKEIKCQSADQVQAISDAIAIIRQHTAALDVETIVAKLSAEFGHDEQPSWICGNAKKIAIAAMGVESVKCTENLSRETGNSTPAREVTYSYKATGDAVMTPDQSSEIRVVDSSLLAEDCLMRFDFDPDFSEGLKQWYRLSQHILDYLCPYLRQPVEPVSLEVCRKAYQFAMAEVESVMPQYGSTIHDDALEAVLTAAGVKYVD